MTDIPYLQESTTFMLQVQKGVDSAEAAVRVIDDEISIYNAEIASRQNRRADLMKIVVPGKLLLTGGPAKGPTLTDKPQEQIEAPAEVAAPEAETTLGTVMPADYAREAITGYVTWLTTRPGVFKVGSHYEAPILFATIDEYLSKGRVEATS